VSSINIFTELQQVPVILGEIGLVAAEIASGQPVISPGVSLSLCGHPGKIAFAWAPVAPVTPIPVPPTGTKPTAVGFGHLQEFAMIVPIVSQVAMIATEITQGLPAQSPGLNLTIAGMHGSAYLQWTPRAATT
jgi:hypothetical protein